ncbi:LysR family transcriptional regulator [Bifidobacterium callimiconis]|uniref:LysR family transcriptional regulator n=1 Tax=Bifidobacterium callimiconis TaxID=2306973 RepID=A0A430FIT5_9BIFI|nr:LysR family transcriptional regulator [Bifidobacterium callimiconis]RSX52628.1 LysR family transcriptional regulator [Bifidobacterium callimiconis]
MELKALRNFITVVDEEGVTAAADVLHVSQPTLSRQIKELENELGTTLFTRGTRSRTLELTSEGRLLYRRAKEITELADRTATEIAVREEVTGDIHISAAQSVVMRTVAKAMVRLHDKHPRVRVHLHDGYGVNITERLNNGLADFGVLVQPTDMSHYDFLPLPGGDPMGLLMRRNHELATHDRITAGDIKGVPVIVPHGVLVRRNLSGWYRYNGEDLNIIGTMNLLYNASRFVEEGYGCAICPAGLVDASGKSDLTFRPLEPPVYTKLAIAWKKSQPLTPASTAFLDELRAVLQGA